MLELRTITEQNEYSSYWQKLNGHLLQSWEWGIIKGPQWQPLRLAVFDGEELVSILSVLKRTSSGITFGYVPKARVEKTHEQQIWELLQKQKLGMDFLLFEFDEPDVSASSFLTKLPEYDYSVQPRWTNRIDLARTPDHLWSGLKGSYRRNINKSERQGVKITAHDTGTLALDQFYDVMKDIFANTKFVMHGKAYFEKVWQYLGGRMARIYLAEAAGRIVGAYFVAYDNDTAYELYGGVTKAGRDVEAGYLLKWKAILGAQELGKTTYDHWGIAPRDKTGAYDPRHELASISSFKAGFGGTEVSFLPTRALVHNPLKFTLFKALNSLHKVSIQLRKLGK